MTRREFLAGAAAFALPLRVYEAPRRTLRLAVITDIHHGLAPDAVERLDAFRHAIPQRKSLDLVLQMGDFCHAGEEADEFMAVWRGIDLPKAHVLGNHDMDRVDKATAMRYWGMDGRFGSSTVAGYRLIVLDLNHFRKDGQLVAYDRGNYFTDNATHNWADPEQLEWLERELSTGTAPTILVSHQPIGLGGAEGSLPPEQREILKVVERARRRNPRGSVAICLCGHLHVDRLDLVQGLPCYCINSASYFWSGGMHPYSKPLFAFLEFRPDGRLVVEGVAGEWVRQPPAASNGITGRSASIRARDLALRYDRGAAPTALPNR
jgi:predicted phosphodiesterase